MHAMRSRTEALGVPHGCVHGGVMIVLLAGADAAVAREGAAGCRLRRRQRPCVRGEPGERHGVHDVLARRVEQEGSARAIAAHLWAGGHFAELLNNTAAS